MAGATAPSTGTPAAAPDAAAAGAAAMKTWAETRGALAEREGAKAPRAAETEDPRSAGAEAPRAAAAG